MKSNGITRINKEAFDSINAQIPDFRLNHAVALELGVSYWMVRFDHIWQEGNDYVISWEKAAD